MLAGHDWATPRPRPWSLRQGSCLCPIDLITASLWPRTPTFVPNCDGAAAESFFATIKTEIGITAWPDRASARRDIENWITPYNQRRLHSAINYRTPAETRRAWQERMAMAI